LLAYDRADFADHASLHPAGALGGMLFHFVPRFTPVFAAQAGTIVYAGRNDTGAAITLDHGNGWATHYAKLEHLFAATRPPYSRNRVETVKAGDVLGYAGGTSLRPLRFELWRKLPDDGGLYRAEDPLPRMTEWIHLPDSHGDRSEREPRRARRRREGVPRDHRRPRRTRGASRILRAGPRASRDSERAAARDRDREGVRRATMNQGREPIASGSWCSWRCRGSCTSSRACRSW
jgi:murein DD-endopeptidase MepM/ murein hydrolase activator NlpD